MVLLPDSRSPNAVQPVIPGEASADYWSTDNVAAVLESGQLLLQSGRIARRSGTAGVRAGDVVTAIWSAEHGLVAHQHAVRRAEFPPPVPIARAHIEELLLLKVGGVWDVWFRDDSVFMPLGLSEFVNHDGTVEPERENPPFVIKWGEGPDTFVVGTSRTVDWASGPPIDGGKTGVPKFYIFKINRKRLGGGQPRPKAELLKILTPVAVASGFVQQSTAPDEEFVYLTPAPTPTTQIVLTRSLDVLMLCTFVRSNFAFASDGLGPQFGSTASGTTQGGAVVIWSAGSNTLVDPLGALNGPFSSDAPATIVGVYTPPGGNPPPTGTSSTISFSGGPAAVLLNWDVADTSKCAVVANVTYIQRQDVSDVISGHALYGSGSRLTASWLYANGALIPLVADQTDSFAYLWSIVSNVFVLSGTTAFTHLVKKATAFASSPLYALASTSEVISEDNPFVFTVKTSGPINIAQGTFDFKLADDPGDTTDLRFLRFVGAKDLYSVAETETIPSSIVAKQRDMLVKFLKGAPPAVVTLTLSPAGKLAKETKPTLKILKPWPASLPTVEDAANSATEALLVPNLLRTDYRLAT